MSEVANILLVQDDPEDRRRTAHALARGGDRVTEVTTGAACLTALGRKPDRIVVLDLRLPDMDGRDLLARIAACHAETPSIVLTEVDDLGVAIEAMQRGAWEYVVKRPDGAHLDDLARALTGARARRDLLRERNRYRGEVDALALALRGTTDGVLVADALGRISFVNRALAAAWRESEVALIGRLLEQLVTFPDGGTEFRDVLSAVAQHGRWTGVMEGRGDAASRAVWEVTLTPLGTANGTLESGRPALVAIFRDVSEKRALEQMRADLLSMVTHDIKVPLTVILGYTEMLSDPEPSPPGEVPRDVITRIRESGEQIHALVCNFLDLSRIESGRLTLNPQPFDLPAMLRRTLDQQAATARRKGLAVQLSEALRLTLVGDEGQLERVMANLLANAVKFTPGGGRVTISTRTDNGSVEVAFRDTGRGIPAAELPNLFEKYSRVREARRTEGTGLGLFIARTIVEAHGGSIRVESVPGEGSTFTVSLPTHVG